MISIIKSRRIRSFRSTTITSSMIYNLNYNSIKMQSINYLLLIIILINNFNLIKCSASSPSTSSASFDYEIIDEDGPISTQLLNNIEKANQAFICKNEGYFADVAFGCQFYHICENSNNPYDKPSFVKHTFSCVNGTVFNQMSFTCTRLDDSIPCEQSAKYFYLNKRNGDPKAYFLTDDDIFKPNDDVNGMDANNGNDGGNNYGGNSVARSAAASSSSSLFNNHNNNQHHSSLSPQPPQTSTTTRSLYSSSLSSSNNDDNGNVDDIVRGSDHHHRGFHQQNQQLNRNRLISSVLNNFDQPIDDDNLNLDNFYDQQNQNDRHRHHSRSLSSHPHLPSPRHQSNAPYELNPSSKLSSTGSSIFPSSPSQTSSSFSATTSSILNRSPLVGKYEPVNNNNKISSYIPLNSGSPGGGDRDDDNDNGIVGGMGAGGGGNRNDIFGSIRSKNINDNYHPHHHLNLKQIDHHVGDPTTIQSLMNPNPNKNSASAASYSAYQADHFEVTPPPPPPMIPTPLPQQRKTTFTPQTFSRLYIETQKQAKYQQQQQHVNPRSLLEQRFAHFNSKIKTPLPPQQSNYPESMMMMKNHQNLSPQNQLMPFMTKYDQYNENRFQSNDGPSGPSSESSAPGLGASPLPSQQYNPSPIRIIKPLTFNQQPQQHGGDDNHPMHQQPGPGGPGPSRTSTTSSRISSFLNNNNNNQNNPQGGASLAGEQPSYVDYGTDYKVVKQVKGKNLLIDPSLENDPARDNIIAQVLEMLSKYN